MPKTIAATLTAVMLTVAAPTWSAETATFNDTARFLAGLPPSPDSPLRPLTKDAAWQQHVRYFDTIFTREENVQLSKVRAFSKEFLTDQHETMLYMFSGPDFLYATSFFPNAKTYVLAGLEPAGPIPQLTNLSTATLNGELRNLTASMSSLLSYSFFITQKMKVQLHEGPVYGTLPLLYVFLARTGKVINDVTLVSLDDAGNLIERDADTLGRGKERRGAASGVRITFSDGDGPKQTLYYFSTDLSDGSFGRSGFATFCAKLGPADSFIKSASYLLHKSSFSGVRKFLLDHSATILQDDSGLPLAYFNRQGWQVRPFGRYAGPLSIFPGAYQSNMAELFRSATPINFGIGYRWRNNESNLLLAQKSGASTSEEVATPNSLSETAAPGTTNQPTKKTRKRVQRNATGSLGCREGGFFPFCSNSAGRRNW